MQMGNWSKARTVVEPIIMVAGEINYRKRMAQIDIILGGYEALQGENEKAIEYLTRSLNIAIEINHRPSIQLSNYWLAVPLYNDCQFERSQVHLNKALEINIEVNSLWGIAAVKSTQAAHFYASGRIDLSYQVSREALQIAEDNQDIYSESFAFTYHGESCFRKGSLKEAVEYLLRAVKVSERISGFRQIFDSQKCLAECYLTTGDYDKSIEYSDAAIFTGEQVKYSIDELNHIRTMIEIANIKRGEKCIDLRSLYGYEHQNRSKLCEGPMRRNIATILVNFNDKHMNESEDWIHKAIEADQKNGMKWDVAMDYTLYADWFSRRCNPPRARENLSKAIEIFKECGADGWVKRTKEKLAQL
jgi:tetratricopeptide (TPR) repeat protein